MNGLSSEKEPKSFGGDVGNFNFLADEIRLVKSIGNLTNTVVKIERMEPWSKRAEAIRMEIVRKSNQLAEIRKLKSSKF